MIDVHAAERTFSDKHRLAHDLALERDLFLKLCISEPALERMRAYEEANITLPSRSLVVEARRASHD